MGKGSKIINPTLNFHRISLDNRHGFDVKITYSRTRAASYRRDGLL